MVDRNYPILKSKVLKQFIRYYACVCWAYEGKVGAKDFNRIYYLLSRVMTNMVFDGEKKSPYGLDFPEFLAKFESLEDAVNDMWILRF